MYREISVQEALVNDKQYHIFRDTITDYIQNSIDLTAQKINSSLVLLYRVIGKEIHLRQQDDAQYGKSIVKRLSKDLQKRFPRARGFSVRNLFQMRSFYIAYQDDEKLQSLTEKISWSHNMYILDRCKDLLEREFYIKMSIRNSWTYKVLMHHVSASSYQKTLLNQTNFQQQLPESISAEASLIVKDSYWFNFIDADTKHSERELEKALLARLEDFLKAMGGLFTFAGSQYRLEIDGNEYFIDILLYHRKLRSLVAVELKIGDFTPEAVGKMQFYLAALDDLVRLEGENPSIGIILTKEKKRTIVEYALKESRKPIGVASYEIVSSLPSYLEKELPSPEEISKLLESI